MALHAFRERSPRLGEDAFVHESAHVIGDVTLGARVSVWFNAVIRGDVNYVRIGEETSIQDLCCLHVSYQTHPLVVGARVTVGHGAILHGCTIGDGCLIGLGSRVLDGAVVGADSMIAAGALVPPGLRVPSGSVAMGVPAQVVREVRPEERAHFAAAVARYVELARTYRGQG